jgi:hypothetical protein
VLGRWERVDLICIDEVGYVPLMEMGAELMFQVIADRAEKAALRGLFRCPRFRWIRSRRPSMIAADGRFSLAPRISATVSGRSALRPVPA